MNWYSSSSLNFQGQAMPYGSQSGLTRLSQLSQTYAMNSQKLPSSLLFLWFLHQIASSHRLWMRLTAFQCPRSPRVYFSQSRCLVCLERGIAPTFHSADISSEIEGWLLLVVVVCALQSMSSAQAGHALEMSHSMSSSRSGVDWKYAARQLSFWRLSWVMFAATNLWYPSLISVSQMKEIYLYNLRLSSFFSLIQI